MGTGIEDVLSGWLRELGGLAFVIWACTQLITGAFKQLQKKKERVALSVGTFISFGAWYSGYLVGSGFEVVVIKGVVATIFARIFHEKYGNILGSMTTETREKIKIKRKTLKGNK